MTLKLLMTTDAVGGVWQYGLDLAQALKAHDVEPVLALLGPPPDPGQRVELRAADVRLIDTGLPLDWLCDAPGPVLAAGAAITGLARDERADLVQLNMPALGAAALPPVPVVAVAHGCVSTWWYAAYPGEPLPADFRWHRQLVGEGLRAADHVAAPTACYARTVSRHYGLGHAPVPVHNGRHPLVSPSGPPLHDSVLMVGRLWDRAKRAELLDRVAGKLAIPFHAAGAVRGPHGEAAKLANLHLLGQLDRQSLAAHLAARPVFVSAASFEPFGLAVLEAAAAGCALVLSDIPGFRELWDGAALFIAGDDEAAYVTEIDRVTGDGALRLRLGEAARQRAQRYTPGAMADRMAALYRRALQTRIARSRVAA